MRSSYFGMFVLALVAVAWIGGCSKSENPVSPTGVTPVSMSIAFSQSGSGSSLFKSTGFGGIDSVRIDSAIVVLFRIKFESHLEEMDDDSAESDSVEHADEGEDDGAESEEESNVTMHGPFVVHVRDTVAISFGEKMIPAGIYTAIKFKIHRLRSGEHHEDSDEHSDRPIVEFDPGSEGASIVVWGAVLKGGAWVPFALFFNGEAEFKIRGNFVIPEATNTVHVALQFNMGLWFRNPQSGELLDPTDTSETNRELFMRAIKHSFGHGWGGHDDDHDGHPDD